jgi:predicted ribosomally synthesized peptide with nif11-like leader
MSIKNVIDFLATIKEDKFLQQKTKMATDVRTIIQIAREYDYQFTSTELQSWLEKMPSQDLASEVNPGIGNRLHLTPR